MQVELRDIRKYFGGVKANDGISIALEDGRIYGLLGENGAGKSTLMKIVSGYQPQDSGDIVLDGQAIKFDSPAEALAQGVGMLYQDPLDFPPFKVIENYLTGRARQTRLDFKSARAELEELSRRYNFQIDPQAQIDSLSMGERQQLELVRLLDGGAELLILDEPTTGISAEQKATLFASIRKLAWEEGKTVILVSHKLDEVQELCGHAFVLRRGKLVGESAVPCTTESLVGLMFGQIPARPRRASHPVTSAGLELQDLFISTYSLDVGPLSMQIGAGEILGLAGLEGSGQGLLLKACAGLIHPAGGRISIGGVDVTSWSYHRRQANGVAYAPAGRLEAGLIAGLSLTEHVLLSQPEHSFMIDWKSAEKETEARIATYQIVGKPASTADQLSGGNQQRLLFALMNSPLKLVLLEHPTRGLDVRSSDWIWELLYRRREDGTAILFISADLDEVIDRSDRIAVFSGGKMSRLVQAKDTSVDEIGRLIGGQQ